MVMGYRVWVGYYWCIEKLLGLGLGWLSGIVGSAHNFSDFEERGGGLGGGERCVLM